MVRDSQNKFLEISACDVESSEDLFSSVVAYFGNIWMASSMAGFEGCACCYTPLSQTEIDTK
jgi:hypothetical protein